MSLAQLMPAGVGAFVEVDLSDSDGITQSIAAVDSNLWASNGAQITAYAQGKGFQVDEYNSAPQGTAERNVYSFSDATIWIDHTAANVNDTGVQQPPQWTQLPDGQDVNIAPGFEYAAVALVKNNHQPSEVKSAITSRSLKISDLKDPSPQPAWAPPPPSGYRYIATIVEATKPGGVLPWSAPWPISVLDSSKLMRVWSAPLGGGKGTPPAAPSSFPIVPVLTVGGLLGLGGLGWWWLRRRRRRG